MGTARKVSNFEYISVPCAENSFAPSLVGEAFAAGERERGMPGRADLDPLSIPGSEYYRRCPERIAGRCGRFPDSDWSDWDKQVWISGCGRRDCCEADLMSALTIPATLKYDEEVETDA